MSDHGVIVLDDVVPSDAIAAMASHVRCRSIKERINAPDRNWMGDVYKTVAFINDFLLGCSYATTADDSRLCVVWKDPFSASRRMIFNDLYHTSRMEYVNTLEIQDLFKYRQIDDIVQDIIKRNAG